MIIFWRLLLAYLINEFIIHTDFLGYWKNYGFKKILIHNVIFLVLAFLLTLPFINTNWVNVYGLYLNGWICLALITILFILQDMWRIHTIKNFGRLNNTLYFLWDQFLHFMIIFVFSPLTGFDKHVLPFTEKSIILACILVVVSYGFTVLIYFVEKDLYKTDFPRFDEKYLLILQRVILWLFFLIPGFYWIPFVILWVVYGIYLKIIDFGKFARHIGFILTAISGIIARYIYFS